MEMADWNRRNGSGIFLPLLSWMGIYSKCYCSCRCWHCRGRRAATESDLSSAAEDEELQRWHWQTLTVSVSLGTSCCPEENCCYCHQGGVCLSSDRQLQSHDNFHLPCLCHHRCREKYPATHRQTVERTWIASCSQQKTRCCCHE